MKEGLTFSDFWEPVWKLAVAWGGYALSGLHATVLLLTGVFTGLQIYILCRDKLGWFKKEK